MIAFADLLSAARAARLLRQTTETYVGAGIDKSVALKGFSSTDHAEALAIAQSLGIEHDEASISAVSSGRFPGPSSSVVTDDVDEDAGGGTPIISLATFGATAVASTSGGAVAVAGSEAMPMAAPIGAPGTAMSTTITSFTPTTIPKGTGKLGDVMLMSIGANNKAAGSFSESEAGDGPHAISAAGEAVASAYSSKPED
ncbi:hypothetical protein MNEG_3878 [Monoraphidium neglectum]|uniref:Uncharacterized protein n=1 Tax=Monoraphidium neglectum TaxID=145388 RepID=A0A0D2MU88_9CHLO|nr:hypothetical protein MNEG_3878 [Monoraphidium neglectum]KIZ04077.1 hypothetical protein MNEG_3878 [Monoraphidium neglectum]|eukprot:XP_013903096.1 hypothetical protein MNEG_3878 [Monoraphidium neglectum]